MADIRKKKSETAGNKQAVDASGGGGLDDSIGLGSAGAAKEPTPVQKPEAISVKVDGKEVTKLFLQFRMGYCCFFVTEEHGTNEITRVHFTNGRVDCGNWGDGRVGSGHIKAVEYDTQRGLWIHFKSGHTVYAGPMFINATYLLA